MYARKPITVLVAACISAGSANLMAQGLEEVVVTAQKARANTAGRAYFYRGI